MFKITYFLYTTDGHKYKVTSNVKHKEQYGACAMLHEHLKSKDNYKNHEIIDCVRINGSGVEEILNIFNGK